MATLRVPPLGSSFDQSQDAKALIREQSRFNSSVRRNFVELQRGLIDSKNIAAGGVGVAQLLAPPKNVIGSILFVGSQSGAPVWAQDVANFSYDATTSALTLGKNPILLSMTTGAVVYVDSTKTLQPTSVPTVGQFLVGSGSTAPTWRKLTAADLPTGVPITPSVSNASAVLTINPAPLSPFERRLMFDPSFFSTVDAGPGKFLFVTAVRSSEVASVSAGAGISVNQSTGAVVVTNTGVTSVIAGAGISLSAATGVVTITNTGVTSTASLSGTANQITLSASGAGVLAGSTSITLSLPQNIHTAATPTFAGLTLSGLSSGVAFSSSAGLLSSRALVSTDLPTLPQYASSASAFLTLDRAPLNPMARRLFLDTNKFSAVDAGPGKFYFVTLNPTGVVTSLIAGSGISLSASSGSVTITNTASSVLTASGPPVANQVAFWTSATNLTGDTGMTYAAGGSLTVSKQFIAPGLFDTTHVDYGITGALNTGLMAGGDGTTGETALVVAGTTMVECDLGPSGTNITFSTPANVSSKSPFRFTPGAQTGVGAGNELQTFLMDAHSVQHNTGDYATQRGTLFNAPTYSFVAASTITNTATVAISGAPIVGANATFTNAYSLWVQSGVTLLTTLNLTNALGVAYGGLGITTMPSNGQIPIGNGATYTAATITAGTGITVTNAAGTITIAATGTSSSSSGASASAAYLTVDAAQTNPLARRLLFNQNQFSTVDAGPGKFYFVGMRQQTAGRVAITDASGNVNTDSGLLYNSTNQSLGIGPSVSVGAAETLSVIATETVTAAAAATWNGINFQASTATLSGTTTVSTATGFNFISVGQPTIARATGNVTVTNAASVYISNSPASGTGVTITNPYALWIDNGNTRLDGDLLLTNQPSGRTPNIRSSASNTVGLGVTTSNAYIAAGSNSFIQLTNTPFVNNTYTHTFQSSATSVFNAFKFATTSFSSGTVSTEMPHLLFDFSAVSSWLDGNITTQRFILVNAPSIAFTSTTSTVTTAATFAIAGAPVASSFATITNAYAFWVQSGPAQFDGGVTASSLTVTGASTHSGAATFSSTVSFTGTVTGVASIASSYLTLDPAPLNPLSRRLMFDPNKFSFLDAGPGKFFYVTTPPITSIALVSSKAPALVNGTMWYDSTYNVLSVWESGVQVSKQGSIFTSTANVALNNTTSETSMYGTGNGTKTLGSNFLMAGKMIRGKISGFYTTGLAPATLTVKVKLGSTIIASVTFTPLASMTSLGWTLEFDLTCQSNGSAGKVIGQCQFVFDSSTLTAAQVDFAVATSPSTVDTTQTQAIDCTFTTGSADANATYTSTNGSIEILN